MWIFANLTIQFQFLWCPDQFSATGDWDKWSADVSFKKVNSINEWIQSFECIQVKPLLFKTLSDRRVERTVSSSPLSLFKLLCCSLVGCSAPFTLTSLSDGRVSLITLQNNSSIFKMIVVSSAGYVWVNPLPSFILMPVKRRLFHLWRKLKSVISSLLLPGRLLQKLYSWQHNNRNNPTLSVPPAKRSRTAFQTERKPFALIEWRPFESPC